MARDTTSYDVVSDSLILWCSNAEEEAETDENEAFLAMDEVGEAIALGTLDLLSESELPSANFETISPTLLILSDDV